MRTADGDERKASSLVVDVVSDIVCPWCFIGKRKLEAALADLGRADPSLGVAIRWHPFQLNPDLPAEGIPRATYLAQKFGAARATDDLRARAGRRRIGRHSVSFRSHRTPAQHARWTPAGRVGAAAR